MEVLDLFNLAPERKLYEIFKHSTKDEQRLLCKNNKFKAICALYNFDENSKYNGPLAGQGRATFKIILESFPDFSSGLQFIEAVRPGFIYTDEFKAYVGDFLTHDRYSYDGGEYFYFQLGKFGYQVHKNTNGEIIKEEWFKDGKYFRLGKPSIIEYRNGEKSFEEWFVNNKLSREDGPARTTFDKIKIEEWFYKGKRHHFGTLHMIINGEDGKLHAVAGPSVKYYKDGNLYREEFWINGEQIA